MKKLSFKNYIKKGLMGAGSTLIFYAGIGIISYVTDSLRFRQDIYSINKGDVQLHINKVEYGFPCPISRVSHQLIIKNGNNEEMIMKRYVDSDPLLGELKRTLNPGVTLENIAESLHDEVITKKNSVVIKEYSRFDVNMANKERSEVKRMFVYTDYLWKFWLKQIEKDQMNQLVRKERIIPVKNK